MGHGQGSFDWRVAEAAAREGVWPDTISTDLHTGNASGEAVRDLANVMAKFLSLGMPLKKVRGRLCHFSDRPQLTFTSLAGDRGGDGDAGARNTAPAPAGDAG